MDQNTEAWLKFRGNSIGASEMPIIMGISPYKKRNVLLREKAFPFPKDENLKKDNDFVFAKGHKYEIKIRNFVEFDADLSFPKQPTVIFSNPNYNTPIHASLDGITEDETIIIECKYMGQDAFHEVKRTRVPPAHYMPQVQQQLLITGAKKCIFAFCREIIKDKVVVELEYDYFDVYPNEHIQHQILEEAKKFWDEVLALRAGGKVEKDYSELDHLVEQYFSNIHAMELLNQSNEILKAKIFEIAGDEKLDRGTYTVQTVISKGRETVDYAGFLRAIGHNQVPVDFVKIGSPSTSQRITLKKTGKIDEKE